MGIEATNKPYEILVPGAKEKFEEWIKSRGGVAVWPNVNLSNAGQGPTFTPAETERGQPTTKPSWQVDSRPCEIVTNLARFRFAKEMREVDRFRVAVRMGAQGFTIKLTDSASEKLRKRLEKAGENARYRFDYGTQEAVIEVPVWK